jgi:hypothetical protein
MDNDKILTRTPERLSALGFGKEADAALNRRRQWRVQQGFGTLKEKGGFRPQSRMLELLRRRDLQMTAQSLSRELDLAHATPMASEQISGTFTRSVERPSGKFVVIQKSQEFTLVPWQPQMERSRGKVISGTERSQGINWD